MAQGRHGPGRGHERGLSLANVQPADAGSYVVVVPNSAGGVTSAVAVLAVRVRRSSRSSRRARRWWRAAATFSVQASGTAPMSYQCEKKAAHSPGRRVPACKSNVQLGDAGAYLVVVANVGSSVTSAVAVLTVQVGPQMTLQPQSQMVAVGRTVTLTAGATGLPAPGYQWRKDGVGVAGATERTLTLRRVQLADAGNYAVVASNAAGSVTSAVAVVTVDVPPVITVQPVGQTVGVGTNVTLNVGAEGRPPLFYQWRWNGAALAGATNASLELSAVGLAAGGTYTVVVSNAFGKVTSLGALLNVEEAPAGWGLVLLLNGTNSLVYNEDRINPLPVGADYLVQLYAEPMQSTWRQRGRRCRFRCPGALPAASGRLWACRRGNGPGCSGGVGERLRDELGRSGEPGRTGGGVEREMVGTGGGLIPPTSLAAVLESFWLVRVGGAGPLAITTEPVNQTVTAGATARFAVVATGVGQLTYQWLFNGVSLAGATNASHTIGAAQAADAGTYSVVVGNGAESVSSEEVVLTVNEPVAVAPRAAFFVGQTFYFYIATEPGVAYVVDLRMRWTRRTGTC